MTAAALNQPLTPARLPGRFARPKPAPKPEPAPRDIRARADFLLEMLEANAEAFRSEADVQAMLYTLPGRF